MGRAREPIGLGGRPHRGRNKTYHTALQPNGKGKQSKWLVRPTNKSHADLGRAGASYLAGILNLGLNLSKKMTKATE